MQTINLVKYIRNGMIFKNLAQYDQYDAIIYESYDNPNITPPANATLYTLEQNQLTMGVGGRLHGIAQQHDRILVVIDTLPVWYLLPVMSTTTKEMTIINLNSGLSGLPAKGVAELQDITAVMSTGRNCGEAFDFVSLFGRLEQPGKNYIRIPHKEYIGNLMPKVEDIDMSSGLLDCRQFNLQGEKGTILCGAGLLPDVIAALGQPEEPGYDLFGILKYDFEVTEALQESFEKTNRLVGIIDQAQQTPYRTYLKGKLRAAGVGHLNHTFITPQTDKLTARKPALLYEQATFDPPGFAQLLT